MKELIKELLENTSLMFCVTIMFLAILIFLRWFITFKAYLNMDLERMKAMDATQNSKPFNFKKLGFNFNYKPDKVISQTPIGET